MLEAIFSLIRSTKNQPMKLTLFQSHTIWELYGVGQKAVDELLEDLHWFYYSYNQSPVGEYSLWFYNLKNKEAIVIRFDKYQTSHKNKI